jgi:hypothetical protein
VPEFECQGFNGASPLNVNPSVTPQKAKHDFPRISTHRGVQIDLKEPSKSSDHEPAPAGTPIQILRTQESPARNISPQESRKEHLPIRIIPGFVSSFAGEKHDSGRMSTQIDANEQLSIAPQS